MTETERDLDRTMRVSNLIPAVEREADSIIEEFQDFTGGIRMLILMKRKKDGGPNDEDKRIFETYVTFSPEEFRSKLINLLLLKQIHKDVRIYMSANARSLPKIVREMHGALVESYYADDECREAISRKLVKNPRHFVMQPSTKETSYFLIDVDDEEGKDIMGSALREIDRLGVVELLRYKTKNGWHIVVQPFNLGLWQGAGEVKRDPLLLLSY